MNTFSFQLDRKRGHHISASLRQEIKRAPPETLLMWNEAKWAGLPGVSVNIGEFKTPCATDDHSRVMSADIIWGKRRLFLHIFKNILHLCYMETPPFIFSPITNKLSPLNSPNVIKVVLCAMPPHVRPYFPFSNPVLLSTFLFLNHLILSSHPFLPVPPPSFSLLSLPFQISSPSFSLSLHHAPPPPPFSPDINLASSLLPLLSSPFIPLPLAFQPLSIPARSSNPMPALIKSLAKQVYLYTGSNTSPEPPTGPASVFLGTSFNSSSSDSENMRH